MMIENVSFEGKVHAVKNDVWKYCGLIPENESSEAQMFGIGGLFATSFFYQINSENEQHTFRNALHEKRLEYVCNM